MITTKITQRLFVYSPTLGAVLGKGESRLTRMPADLSLWPSVCRIDAVSRSKNPEGMSFESGCPHTLTLAASRGSEPRLKSSGMCACVYVRVRV